MKNQDLRQVELARRVFSRGRRVRFLGFGEAEPETLTPGTEGTVAFVDSIGTVHVNWDNGVALGVIVVSGDGRQRDRISPLGDGPSWY
jgi:hypothetical protein